MRFASLAAASAALCLLAGCHVTTHKNGGKDNVDIGTPFGSMHVKTNEDAATGGMGITPYPGAVLLKKDKDGHDDGAADVNMNFGSFHLGVKAATYTTSDSPSMVLAYYKKDLGKYGVVLECEGHHALGSVTRTAEGLTCDENSNTKHINWNSDTGDKTELRAGSKQHQHIIAVEKKDGGTKIGMVALDLPAGIGSKDNDDKDSD